ncbi:MAG: DUF551 domain-containing protein [Planctomycetota bacterium]
MDWINSNERLPDAEDWYIVFRLAGRTDKRSWSALVTTGWFVPETQMDMHSWEGRNDIPIEVSHWMPLPAAPGK